MTVTIALTSAEAEAIARAGAALSRVRADTFPWEVARSDEIKACADKLREALDDYAGLTPAAAPIPPPCSPTSGYGQDNAMELALNWVTEDIRAGRAVVPSPMRPRTPPAHGKRGSGQHDRDRDGRRAREDRAREPEQGTIPASGRDCRSVTKAQAAKVEATSRRRRRSPDTYKYADLGDVDRRQSGPLMAKHGLAFHCGADDRPADRREMILVWSLLTSPARRGSANGRSARSNQKPQYARQRDHLRPPLQRFARSRPTSSLRTTTTGSGHQQDHGHRPVGG